MKHGFKVGDFVKHRDFPGVKFEVHNVGAISYEVMDPKGVLRCCFPGELTSWKDPKQPQFKVGDKVRYCDSQSPSYVTEIEESVHKTQIQLNDGSGIYPWVFADELTSWEGTCECQNEPDSDHKCKSPSCDCGIACEVMTLDADGNLSGPPTERFPGLTFIPDGYQAWLTDESCASGPVWVAPGAIVTIRENGS